MHISCIHCGHHFDHEVAAYERGSATAICPACGRETPATEAWGLDGTNNATGVVESRVYCFNCGKAMTPREGELIPVCDDCRQDRGDEAPGKLEAPDPDGPVADWMIRKANKKVYGPFPAETIVEWIDAKKIHADEEIAHIGGAWRLFGQHEQFGKYFEGTTEVSSAAPQADLDFRRRTPVRDALRASGRVAGILAILGLGGGLIWTAVQRDWLVLGDSTVNNVTQVLDSAQRSDNRPVVDEDVKRLIEEISAEHPDLDVQETDRPAALEHLLRGRTLLLRDGVPDLLAARGELEKAFLLDPSSPLVAAALAELYNVLSYRGLGPLELQRKSIYLLDLAEHSGNFGAEAARARAAFLVYSGNPREGQQMAAEALQKNPADPELYFLTGIAQAQLGGGITDAVKQSFDKALELDPGFHQVYFQLGQGAEASGDIRGAVARYSKKLELDPRSSAAHERLGAIYELIGKRGEAATHYDAAIRLHKQNQPAVIRRAILAYQLEGAADRAATLLTGLLEDQGVELRIRDRIDALVHLAAARRLAGDLPGSLAAADEALKKDRAHAGALFQKGITLMRMGQAGEAVPLFSRADTPDLSNPQRARVLFWQGHAGLEADQIQDAVDSFSRSASTDESFIPAYMWKGFVTLRLSTKAASADQLIGHLGQDPLDYARPRDPDLFYEPLPSLQPVTDAFVEALQTEVYAPRLKAALGVVLVHQGRLKDGRRALDAARKQEERNEAAMFYLGLIEFQEGNTSKAAAFWKAVQSIDSGKGVYYQFLGEALMKLDRLAAAVADFERGLAKGATHPWARSQLAAALAKSGDKERAITQLQKAASDDPTAIEPRWQRFDLEL